MSSDTDEKVAWLFLDLNSYFASVEQQLNPKLRGRPVAVVPILADSTSVIAASYEAKKFGVKTGVRVGDAKKMCPGIILIEAGHEAYVKYHNQIVEAVESCLPVHAVHSIDEMACKLMGRECEIQNAIELAQKVKRTIKERVGEMLVCSVGLGPNRYLAKIAADMQKPDGLTVITKKDLPHILYKLKPIDCSGIGSRMNEHLLKHGITTMKQLTDLDVHHLREIWGGINGERFWFWIHGYEIADIKTKKSSLSHSHVLEPQLRNLQGAYGVLQRLLHKAAYRLRKDKYWTNYIQVSVKCIDGSRWDEDTKLIECQDTLTLLESLQNLWAGHTLHQNARPIKVSLALGNLIPDEFHTLSLFDNQEKRERLSQAIDKINAKLGKNMIHFAGIQATKTSAPTRIAFQSVPDEFD